MSNDVISRQMGLFAILIPTPLFPQVWIRSLGSCYNRYCWSFLRLGVDGWLLGDLDEAVMERLLGVDDSRARTALMAGIRQAIITR